MMVVWSFVLTFLGLASTWLAGRHSRWGWAIGFFSQLLWGFYAAATQQWGFILSAALFVWVYARNFQKWSTT